MNSEFQLDEALTETLEYQRAHLGFMAEEESNSPTNSRRDSKERKKSDTSFSTYTAYDLQKKEFPEPVCVVENILPLGLALLAGVPKGGKSWLVLGVGLAKAYGGVALDKIRVSCGDVLYLALEDTPRRLQSRINQLLAPGETAPERLHITHVAPRIGEGLIEVLLDWLNQYPEAQLIIIDTLARIRKPKSRGADIYAEDSEVIARLQKLALQKNIAILLVHHLRKAVDEDPLAMVSGSFGLTGSADAVLVLKRGRGSKDATLSITGRDIEERELALTFEHGFWKLLGDAADVQRSQERRAIMHLLRQPPPLTPKEVAGLLGKNYSAVKKLLWKMSQDGELSAVEGKYTLTSADNNRGNYGNPGNPVTQQEAVTQGYSDPVTHNRQENSELAHTVTTVTSDGEGEL